MSLFTGLLYVLDTIKIYVDVLTKKKIKIYVDVYSLVFVYDNNWYEALKFKGSTVLQYNESIKPNFEMTIFK